MVDPPDVVDPLDVVDPVPVVVPEPVVVPVAGVVVPEPDVVPVAGVVVELDPVVVAGADCTCRTACPRLKPSTVIAFCRSAKLMPRFVDAFNAATNCP